MHHHPVLRGIRIAIFVIIGVVVFGFIVEGLWNVLVPPIFGWHTITFWQGIGLLLLSKILFGGFHRHGPGGRNQWKHRMKDPLGADDTRRARKISPRNALRSRSLRLNRGASDMNKFDASATNTAENTEQGGYKDRSSSIRYRPSAASDNDRLAELETENSRLHRLVAELLIKNQQLRKAD